MNQRIVAVCSPAMLERRGLGSAANGNAASWLPHHLIHIMGHEDHWLRVRQALQLPAELPAARGPSWTPLSRRWNWLRRRGCALAHAVSWERTSHGRLVRALEHDFPR